MSRRIRCIAEAPVRTLNQPTNCRGRVRASSSRGWRRGILHAWGVGDTRVTSGVAPVHKKDGVVWVTSESLTAFDSAEADEVDDRGWLVATPCVGYAPSSKDLHLLLRVRPTEFSPVVGGSRSLKSQNHSIDENDKKIEREHSHYTIHIIITCACVCDCVCRRMYVCVYARVCVMSYSLCIHDCKWLLYRL